MQRYPDALDKDWEARFKPSEHRSWPNWYVRVLIALIPIPCGPWWVTVPISVALLAAFIFFERARHRSR
jgi:hypothetical protein